MRLGSGSSRWSRLRVKVVPTWTARVMRATRLDGSRQDAGSTAARALEGAAVAGIGRRHGAEATDGRSDSAVSDGSVPGRGRRRLVRLPLTLVLRRSGPVGLAT